MNPVGVSGTIGPAKPWEVRFTYPFRRGYKGSSEVPYAFDDHHSALRFAQRSLAGDLPPYRRASIRKVRAS